MKKYTQKQVQALLAKQRALCADAVREPYKKNGMTNLAKRAYGACINTEIIIENEKRRSH